MNYRIKILKIILMCLFLPLLVSLYYLQIYKGDFYHKKSIDNILRILPHSGLRGTVKDRNGEILVKDIPSFEIAVIPQEVEKIDSVLEILSERFSISVAELKEIYKKNYRYPFVPVNLIVNISKQDAINFEAYNNLRGVILRVEPIRKYYFNNVASHILGYLGEIDFYEFKKLKQYGYSVSDYIGKSGIEGYFDSYLRGQPGGKLIEVNNKSQKVKTLGSKQPTKGKDIKISIDIELQRFIEENFFYKKGAVVVMNPKNGHILSMVSKPNFDPNKFLAKNIKEGYVKKLLRSTDAPLFNRAVSGVYQPGSIFKMVIASAGLSEKVISWDTKFLCEGEMKIGSQSFRCWYRSGHGRINLLQALEYSCNIYFYKLGLRLGAEKIYQFAKKFGLGEKTGIELLGESEGLLPTEAYKRKKFNTAWFPGDTANLSIGQGFVGITPLQAVRMVSAIANQNFIPKPKLVIGMEDVDLTVPELTYFDVLPDVLNKVEKGLVRVVESSAGTGRLANVNNLKIAGKTGTAQVSGKKSHAWFIGYAPVENPHISLAVVIEHGGKGGFEAARFAKKIFQYYKTNLNVK